MTGDCRGRRLTPQDHLVVGVAVDDETRCAHYRSERDIVAIRFPCCETYYPCFRCHETCVNHDAERWPRGRFNEPAVCCGACGTELSVRTTSTATTSARTVRLCSIPGVGTMPTGILPSTDRQHFPFVVGQPCRPVIFSHRRRTDHI